jgi:fucose 4-O-acetylase-like acetyltransferase
MLGCRLEELFMNDRIRWIDYGKGFAIFLVIIGHAALGLLESNQYSGNNQVLLHFILESVYAVHIPAFFALSGYFFKPLTRLSDLLIKAKKRFVSLGVPYLVFSVVMVVLKFIGGNTVRNQNGLIGLLDIYRQPIDYLWFLYALFFVDVFVNLLSFFIKNKVFEFTHFTMSTLQFQAVALEIAGINCAC